MKIPTTDPPRSILALLGPISRGEAEPEFAGLLDLEADDMSAWREAGEKAIPLSDVRHHEAILLPVTLPALVLAAPLPSAAPSEARSEPGLAGRLDLPIPVAGPMANLEAAIEQPDALWDAPAPAPLQEPALDQNGQGASSNAPFAQPARQVPVAADQAASDARLAVSLATSVSIPPDSVLRDPAMDVARALALPAARLARLRQTGTSLPHGPSPSNLAPDSRKAGTGTMHAPGPETAAPSLPMPALADRPSQSGPEWSSREGAPGVTPGDHRADGRTEMVDATGNSVPPGESGQRIQDVALAITATEALDIRMTAASEEARAEIAGQADRLVADLQQVGAKVEALRVETGRGVGADGGEGAAGGQQPGPGDRGSAARQEDAGRTHRAGVNGPQGRLAAAAPGGGGKVDRYA